MFDICLDKENSESKITPKFLTFCVGEHCEPSKSTGKKFDSQDLLEGVLKSMNSVLSGFNFSLFCAIHSWIDWRHFCRILSISFAFVGVRLT